MSLAHAILGILKRWPMTGYDLKTQAFDASIAHFWPADQAQIYRTLDKMTEQGWVESHIEYQEDRPNRKVYSVTEEGKRELNRWLKTPQSITPYRESFLIQLFHAPELSNEQIAELLKGQMEAHRERLERYLQIPLPPLDSPDTNRDLTLQRLTLELGIRLERAQLDWLSLALETVRNLPES